MIRKPSLRRRRGAEQAPGAEPITSAPALDAAAPAGDAAAPAAERAQAEAPTAVHPVVAGEGPGATEPASAALPPGEPATAVFPATAVDGTPTQPVAGPDASAPAGLELQPAGPGPDADHPSFKDRGRLRRRLRYLRRVRELGFRDLGGLVFDLHRFERDGTRLVAGKLEALGAVDHELRALEDALDDREDVVVLREPGIAACVRCAALHGSDANFCPNCGLRLSGPQAMSEIGDAPAAAPAGPLPAAAPVWGAPAPPAPTPPAPVPAAGAPAPAAPPAGAAPVAPAAATPGQLHPPT